MNIIITPAAEKFMRRMVRFNGGSAQAGFRLKVSTAGCSGLSAEFTVEEKPVLGDASLDCNGLAVYLPAESRLLLEGATIDFGDTPAATGLTFRTPRAASGSCGSHAEGAPPAHATVGLSSIQRKRQA
ncbi:HesB/IscA family protein [Oxalobacteraceae bacterium A2-2]